MGNNLSVNRSFVVRPQPSITGFLSRGAGICLALLVLLLAMDQPVAPAVLAALLAVYIGLLLRWPVLWLWVLPTALTGIDLAPLTGRLSLDEFDLFVLATAASGLLAGRYGRDSWTAPPAARAVIAFWFLTVLVAIGRGLLPWSPLDATAWANTYLTPYNALRVGKGPLSAMLLLPLWLGLQRDYDQKANIHLISGVSLGLIVCGLYILWDRWVIAALFALDRWGLINNLFDFSTTYRATGNMSQMHTGGSAIDGYLTLAFALSAAGLLAGRVSRHRVLAGLATLAGAYAITVTFTRGTYAAAGVSLLALAVFALSPTGQARSRRLSLWPLIAAIIPYLALLAVVRTRGGLGGTLGMAAVCLGAAAITAFRVRRSTAAYLSGLALVAIAGAAISGYAMLTSRWAETSLVSTLVLAEAGGIAATAVGSFAWSRTCAARLGGRILIIFCLSALMPLGILASGGYRMQYRFSGAEKDFETRAEHWHHSLGLLEGSWQNWLLGLGLGAFPRAYVLSTDPASRVGTYLYAKEGGNRFLRLGGGRDLRLGQRIDIPRDETGPLVLSGIARTTGDIKQFGCSICRRRLLEQEAYNPTCTYFSVKVQPDSGIWQPFERKINISKEIGGSSWTDPRATLLRLGNGTAGTLVELDNLVLRGISGRNYLQNGDFSSGGDRWLSYNDFEHLAWHAKNLYLAILIDQGLLGLAGFLALTALALSRARWAARTGDAVAIGTVAVTAAWLTLGWVATLIDVPRNTFLYFLLLLAVTSMREIRSTAQNAQTRLHSANALRNLPSQL